MPKSKLKGSSCLIVIGTEGPLGWHLADQASVLNCLGCLDDNDQRLEFCRYPEPTHDG
jgi:hypothetical protein